MLRVAKTNGHAEFLAAGLGGEEMKSSSSEEISQKRRARGERDEWILFLPAAPPRRCENLLDGTLHSLCR
jgi:hypothetical protein